MRHKWPFALPLAIWLSHVYTHSWALVAPVVLAWIAVALVLQHLYTKTLAQTAVETHKAPAPRAPRQTKRYEAEPIPEPDPANEPDWDEVWFEQHKDDRRRNRTTYNRAMNRKGVTLESDDLHGRTA